MHWRLQLNRISDAAPGGARGILRTLFQAQRLLGLDGDGIRGAGQTGGNR